MKATFWLEQPLIPFSFAKLTPSHSNLCILGQTTSALNKSLHVIHGSKCIRKYSQEGDNLCLFNLTYYFISYFTPQYLRRLESTHYTLYYKYICVLECKMYRVWIHFVCKVHRYESKVNTSQKKCFQVEM